ncbi:MAG: hypothetical protein QW215_07485 [Ignisphaera sp.]
MKCIKVLHGKAITVLLSVKEEDLVKEPTIELFIKSRPALNSTIEISARLAV